MATKNGNQGTSIQKAEPAEVTRREPRSEMAEQQRPALQYTPLVDVGETPDAFVFEADLPGATAEDVDVSYDNGTLTIAAQVKPRQSGPNYLWSEYGVGHFYRSFTIDAPIDVDAITAKLHDGVLSLRVPKAESAKTRKIQVSGT